MSEEKLFIVERAVREGRSGAIRTSLTDGDGRALYALIQSQGWDVLLDMMEMECIKQETSLVNVDNADHVRVIAEHAMSKAFWLFFVRIQKNVLFQINEAITPKLGAPLPLPVSEDDEEIQSIVSAVPTASD